MLSVPIDDNEDSIMGLGVALLTAYWKANNEVYRSIYPWAALLRQQLHASMWPMPYRAHTLAGRACPSIGLDLARHTWLVIFPGY